MSNLTKQVFQALTVGIVWSVIISAVIQQYPEFAPIGVLLFVVGLIVALYEFYGWYRSSEVDNVIPFILGAVNAVFGLAIAFATTDHLIKMLVAAAVLDAVFGILAKLGVGE